MVRTLGSSYHHAYDVPTLLIGTKARFITEDLLKRVCLADRVVCLIFSNDNKIANNVRRLFLDPNSIAPPVSKVSSRSNACRTPIGRPTNGRRRMPGLRTCRIWSFV